MIKLDTLITHPIPDYTPLVEKNSLRQMAQKAVHKALHVSLSNEEIQPEKVLAGKILPLHYLLFIYFITYMTDCAIIKLLIYAYFVLFISVYLAF